MKKLDDLKVGDKVVHELTFGNPRILIVKRITKQYVECSNGILYRKHDGKPRGSTIWTTSHVRLPKNEAEVDEILFGEKARKIQSEIETFKEFAIKNISEIQTESLISINDIINKELERRKNDDSK